MMQKITITLMIIYIHCFAGINMGGKIFDLQTQQGIGGAIISIAGTNLSTTTSSDGSFTISNIPIYSTGFQFKASKTGYVDTYTQLGNAGGQDAPNDVNFPMFSNTMYSNLHNSFYGGIAHTSGKGDILGMVTSNTKAGVSDVIITAKYIDNNANAGTIRYVNASNMPDSSLTATSSNGSFIIYNVDPYKPIKLIGTKQGSVFSSCVLICHPDSVTVGGINQIDSLLQISGKVLWDENPISGAIVSIPGATGSTTTAVDGSFSINYNPTSYGILKISKTNYVDTYFAARADESEGKKQNGGDDGNEFFIIPQADYTTILNSLGKTHIAGKGDIHGQVETINGMNVANARISVYDKNGIRLNPDIFYFNEEHNPATGLIETTSSSEFLILNLDPGYYFITAEKSGMEFSRNMSVVFPNGITNGPQIIGWPSLPGITKNKAQDIPATNIGNNAQNIAMLAFQFHIIKWDTSENVIFDSIIVTAKGTGNISTALSSAKLYLDADNNGTFETEVSTGTISGNKIIFRNINKEIDIGLNQKYMVIFNFNGTASIGQTFGVDILKNADVYAHSKNTGISITCDGEPITGNLMTIAQSYPPLKPVNIYPPNNQIDIVPNAYYIQSSNFNPGQGTSVHKASEWRIWKDGETYETLTWYSGVTTTSLMIFYLPVLLESSTKYWWQVRHQNGDSIWSEWSDPTCFTTVQGGVLPPAKPVNISPEDSSIDVQLPVILSSSQFVQGSNSFHAASQWQVFLASKTDTPVFDSKRNNANLTSITVTGLSYNTQYLWRVRYQDGNGAWSEWSDFTTFTTKQGMKGDLNHDTQIDISDVILCLRMAIGLDPIDIGLGDMNDDQQVDISDVILILRKAIGLD
ncbi:MAG: hypothetical protein N2115_00555 [bacterium]|nr:hypothetical protein [bacterium]